MPMLTCTPMLVSRDQLHAFVAAVLTAAGVYGTDPVAGCIPTGEERQR